jgi:hypothetical protein
MLCEDVAVLHDMDLVARIDHTSSDPAPCGRSGPSPPTDPATVPSMTDRCTVNPEFDASYPDRDAENGPTAPPGKKIRSPARRLHFFTASAIS